MPIFKRSSGFAKGNLSVRSRKRTMVLYRRVCNSDIAASKPLVGSNSGPLSTTAILLSNQKKKEERKRSLKEQARVYLLPGVPSTANTHMVSFPSSEPQAKCQSLHEAKCFVPLRDGSCGEACKNCIGFDCNQASHLMIENVVLSPGP